ncbi:hypothetical protein, partial [Nocardia sp. NPDC059239]|uniref:hypothetical protein n=1 Tax=Nocardia sp. NPDC059239 TaxID=3346785 RepID=UPI0036B979D0
CANKPVRADYLDTVVWDHSTALMAGPQLIRTVESDVVGDLFPAPGDGGGDTQGWGRFPNSGGADRG